MFWAGPCDFDGILQPKSPELPFSGGAAGTDRAGSFQIICF
jgi:hypothetical protein